jgi:N12 class adenine-specific DNA methylase
MAYQFTQEETQELTNAIRQLPIEERAKQLAELRDLGGNFFYQPTEQEELEVQQTLSALPDHIRADREKQFKQIGLIAPQKDGFWKEGFQTLRQKAYMTGQELGMTLSEFGVDNAPKLQAYFDKKLANRQNLAADPTYRATSLALGDLGRTIGGAIGDTATGMVAAGATTALTGGNTRAGMVAGIGSMFAKTYGRTMQEYRQVMPNRTEKEIENLALASSLIQSAIEYAPIGVEAGALKNISKLVSKKHGAKLASAIARSRSASLGAAALKTAKNTVSRGLGEGVEEILQGITDDVAKVAGGASREYLNSLRDYLEQFVGGTIGGIGLGAVGLPVEFAANYENTRRGGNFEEGGPVEPGSPDESDDYNTLLDIDQQDSAPATGEAIDLDAAFTIPQAPAPAINLMDGANPQPEIVENAPDQQPAPETIMPPVASTDPQIVEQAAQAEELSEEPVAIAFPAPLQPQEQAQPDYQFDYETEMTSMTDADLQDIEADYETAQAIGDTEKIKELDLIKAEYDKVAKRRKQKKTKKVSQTGEKVSRNLDAFRSEVIATGIEYEAGDDFKLNIPLWAYKGKKSGANSVDQWGQRAEELGLPFDYTDPYGSIKRLLSGSNVANDKEFEAPIVTAQDIVIGEKFIGPDSGEKEVVVQKFKSGGVKTVDGKVRIYKPGEVVGLGNDVTMASEYEQDVAMERLGKLEEHHKDIDTSFDVLEFGVRKDLEDDKQTEKTNEPVRQEEGFELESPTEDQLRAEKAARKEAEAKKKQLEDMEEERQAPVKGGVGDIQNGVLFPEDENLFSGKSAEAGQQAPAPVEEDILQRKPRSLKQLNTFLRKNGMPKELEIVKGDGYFYVYGEPTGRWAETSIYTNTLESLTLGQWLSSYQDLAAKAEERQQQTPAQDPQQPIRIGPAPAENQSTPVEEAGDKKIGKNRNGHDLFEDERGVRYYVEKGFKLTEPVAMRPTNQGMGIDVGPRRSGSDWLTTDEQSALEKKETGESSQKPTGVLSNVSEEKQKRAAELKARIKAKLNRTSMGVDPTLLTDAIELTAIYVEGGTRKFSEYAKQMYDAFGDSVKPYLKSWWLATRHDPSVADYMKEMDGEAVVEDADIDAVVAGAKAEAVDNASESDKLAVDKPKEAANARPIRTGTRKNDEGTQAEGNQTTGESRPVSNPPGRSGGEQRGQNSDSRKPSETTGNGVDLSPRTKSDNANEVSNGEATTGRSQRDGNVRDTRDFTIGRNFAQRIGEGSAKVKAKQNVEAIRILKTLEEEGRLPTSKEQEALGLYVAWGSSELANNMFRRYNRTSGFDRAKGGGWEAGWEGLGQELETLLTDKELEAVKKSTQYAHYTSPSVISSIYNGLTRMGFDGGYVLEPGSGIGLFAGLMPASIRNKVRFTGVERDSIPARIAKLLYPGHDMREADFVAFNAPDSFYDAAIGNPPFSSNTVKRDPKYRKYNLKLHDYFIAKTMDKVRQGGVVALVSSRGTMDKQDARARQYITDQADLVGAIRLPNTAFKQNAGTEVVTDIMFFRKRMPGEEPGGAAWTETKTISTPDGEASINEYFAKNPSMVLGNHRLTGSMYGGNEYTVEDNGKDLKKLLDKAIRKLPQNILMPATTSPQFDQDAVLADLDPGRVLEYAYYEKDGVVYQKVNGVGVPLTRKRQGTKGGIAHGKLERIKMFIPLRDSYKEVQRANMTGDGLQDAQRKLKTAYNNFTKKFGPINKVTVNKSGTRQRPNFTPFKDDPTAYGILALENYDEQSGKVKSLADIFDKDLLVKDKEPEIVEPVDAMNVSLEREGKINIREIAKLLDTSEDDAIHRLGDAVYFDPIAKEWQDVDSYLSGDVKTKLEQATSASEADPKFKRNVEALKQVIPEDLPPSKITLDLGSSLVPADDVQAFAREVLKISSCQIHFNQASGKWTVKSSVMDRQNASATSEWGTKDRNSSLLLKAALNNGSIRITKAERKPGGGYREVFDEDATRLAKEKHDAIRSAFRKWAFQDGERSAKLVSIFNEKVNRHVDRKYSAEFLTFPGMSKRFQPYEHQKSVVWRIVQDGNAYMAHEVGAGKTLASIAAGMEMRRLGLVKKPMYVVPNHVLKQFAAEFQTAYPLARVLVADDTNFTKARRRGFIGLASNNDWDAVVISHSSFGKIPVHPKTNNALIKREIRAMQEALETATDGDAPRHVIKQIQKQIENLEDSLASLVIPKQDQGTHFEEMGVDYLFVDEAHEFRKLSFATAQSNIKGVDPNGSKMAWDLYAKTRALQNRNPSRFLTLMSGTPITNTIGELFTVQRYLQETRLEELGLNNFDPWVSTFGQVVQELESTPTGYRPVARLREWKNMNVLAQMWRQYGDVVFTGDLSYLTLPELDTGKAQEVIGTQTEAQKRYAEQLKDRALAIKSRKGPPKKGDDIIPSVITDGKHAAIDQRMINPSLPADPNSKLEKLISNVFKIYKETAADKSAQAVFSDLGVPASLKKRGFSTYFAIKDELVKQGVPASEIAFIHDANTLDKKRLLFERVNKGQVRVIIGGRGMETGANIQTRLVALHHLDAPWFPASLMQREGRIIRQGNTNKKVYIYQYITKGSYDEQVWGILTSKVKWLSSFLKGATDDRAEDIGVMASQYEQLQALTSNDPRILTLASQRARIAELESLRRAHIDSKHEAASKIRLLGSSVRSGQERLEELKRAKAQVKPVDKDNFSLQILGKNYTKQEEAGQKIIQFLSNAFSMKKDTQDIGTYAGGSLIVAKPFLSSAQPKLFIKWASGYDREIDLPNKIQDQSRAGLIIKLNNAANLESHEKSLIERIDKVKEEIESFKKQEAKPFEQEEELKTLEQEAHALEEELTQEAMASENKKNPEVPKETPGEEKKYRTGTTQSAPALTKPQKIKLINFWRKAIGNDKIGFVPAMVEGGLIRLGKYENQLVTIAEGQANPMDTAMHEAVHAALDMLVTAQEKKTLLDAVNGDEEKLAENIINFANKNTGSIPAKIRRVIGRVVRAIRKLFGAERQIDKVNEFYDNLLGGKLRQRNEVQQPGTELAPAYRKSITPTMDKEYMAAVEAGDMATAHKMVDEAAKQAGYRVPAFHGTAQSFNIFDESLRGASTGAASAKMAFFFADNPEMAKYFATHAAKEIARDEMNAERERLQEKERAIAWEIITSADGKVADRLKAIGRHSLDPLTARALEEANPDLVNKIKKWYEIFQARQKVTLTNPRSIGEEINRAEAKGRVQGVYLKIDNPLRQEFNGQGARSGKRSFPQLLQEAREKGNDGTIFFDVEDGSETGTVFTVFSPSQIKSADPVVKDDQGNVIPLSERFNSESNDIRYRTELAIDKEAEYKKYEKGTPMLQTAGKNILTGAKIVTRALDRMLGTLSNRIEKIAPEIFRATRALMRHIDLQDAKDLAVYRTFVKAQKVMSKADRRRFELARLNADEEEIHKILSHYGQPLGKAYTDLRKMLNDFVSRMETVGVDINPLKTYHPRKVKDYVGLISHLKKTNNWTHIQREIDRRNAKLGPANNLSVEEEAIIADQMLRGTIPGLPANPTDNTKARTIEFITADMMEFYQPADVALAAYIRDNNRMVEWLKFLGAVDSPTKQKLQRLGQIRRAIAAAAKRKDTKRANALTEKREELLEELGMDGNLPSDAMQYVENSLGMVVNKLAAAKKLTAEQEVDLKALINALWNDTGITSPFLSFYRDTGLIGALGQFSSAVTQIQDNTWSFFLNGPWHTSKAFVKALTRNSDITRDSIVPDIMPEFSHSRKASWILSNILKWTLMDYMDTVGKETLMNASVSKMKAEIKKMKNGSKQSEAWVREHLGRVFGDHFYETMADIIKGDPDNDTVKAFSHFVLSEFQPLNRLETPEAYKGNARIAYMLKTYQIKQINNYRTLIARKMRKYSQTKDIKAIKDLFAQLGLMAFWLALMGATSDMIKDLIYGREIKPEELASDVVAQTFGLSRWDMYNIRREGLSGAALKRVFPVNKLLDHTIKDIISRDPDGLRSSTLMPVFGKFYYWHYGRGARKYGDKE